MSRQKTDRKRKEELTTELGMIEGHLYKLRQRKEEIHDELDELDGGFDDVE